MIPVVLFLWTAVLRPFIAWLKGEPLGKKGEKGSSESEGGENTTGSECEGVVEETVRYVYSMCVHTHTHNYSTLLHNSF